MAKTPEKQVASIGVGFVLGWLLSVGSLFVAFGVRDNSNGAIVMILAALCINPTFWSLVKTKFNFQLTSLLRIIVFSLLLFIAVYFF